MLKLRGKHTVDDTEFYSRNWAFITPEVQTAVREKRLFFAGVGLGSAIAAAACRTGFVRFIVADSDRVELSNLNRQAYRHAQVGRNKAQATAELLRSIRPDVDVRVLPHRLDTENYLAPLAEADIAVSSIDFHEPALFRFNRSAQVFHKPVLIPLNLGWGGAVLVFTHDSPALEAFIGYDPDQHGPSDVLKLLLTRIFAAVPGGLPPYLGALFARLASGEAWESDPQLAAAAHLTSALAVRAAVALVAGEPVRTVPDVIYSDLRMLCEPATSRKDEHAALSPSS